MNDDVIADFKQFITVTIQQAVADLAARVDDLSSEMGSMRSEMHAGFNELELKLETIADAHSEQLAEHERRLIRLEQRTA